MTSTVFQRIKTILPRAGRRAITDPEIVKMIQDIFGDEKVIKVIACKGTERAIPPPRDLHPKEAPFCRAMVECPGSHDVLVGRMAITFSEEIDYALEGKSLQSLQPILSTHPAASQMNPCRVVSILRFRRNRLYRHSQQSRPRLCPRALKLHDRLFLTQSCQ